MDIKDIMTREVISVHSSDTVETAAQLMKQYNIGSIPVCEDQKVIGIITDRDITLRSASNGQNVMRQTVREIMTSNPVTVKSSTDVHEAARIMGERQIRRLPVVENGKLVGIVSIGDLAVVPELKDNIGESLSSISEP